MPVFSQTVTITDNTKIIFGDVCYGSGSYAGFPYIKWTPSQNCNSSGSGNWDFENQYQLMNINTGGMIINQETSAGASNNGILATFTGGAVGLYHCLNGSTNRLVTTSSGIDITGQLDISTINNATSDTDKFLVSDGGVVKYRTGAEVLSDIGSGVGTVQSVAALTLGTTGTDLSSTVANSTSTPVITLNVPTASASNRGALSSADWSTFNGKMASFTIQGDTGSTSISNGNTVDISGGTGITTAESSGTVTVTNSKPFDGIAVAGTSGGSTTITNSGTITIAAGSGITTTNSSGTVTIAATGGGGSMSSWTIQGDSGSSTVSDGETMDVAGGTYITTSESSRTLTVNHDTTSRTDNTSSTSPGSGGTFTAVDSVTTNSTGHITALNTKTVTMPSVGVTSVNFKTDGNSLNVASNSITGSGTMTGVWQGTTAQYVNGEGDLITFPSIPTNTNNYVTGGSISSGVVTLSRTGLSDVTFNINNNQITNGANYTTNTGTVTGVTGTAPVVSSGGTAPAISMAAATTSVDGYLTSGNFTTFNNKMTNFTIEADTGGAATIDNGDAIDIIGGTSITTHRSGNNITINSSAAGTVVSVGMAVPPAFTVTGTPITTTGTFTIAGAGTSSQYVRGDGGLATFPTIPSAGVTSVATGSGLTGGTIISTGTVSVDYSSAGLIADCPGGTGSPDENDLIMIGLDSSSSGETRSYEIQEITSLAPQGTVTSVAVTAGAGISVSGSPITSSGTITVTNTITNNNQLTNGAGYTTNTGTVTTVSAANPTSGGAAGFPLFITSTASTTPVVNLNQGQITGTKVSTATGGGVTSGTWNANTQLDKTSNTDNDYQGEIVYFGTAASSPLAQGKLYIYTTTDGEWAAAKADAVGTSAGLLAIALGTTVSAGMFTRGMYTNGYTTTGSSNGSILYIDSVNAGSMTHEPPSGTGKFVRIIATQLDSTNGQIFFHPDNTFIELA